VLGDLGEELVNLFWVISLPAQGESTPSDVGGTGCVPLGFWNRHEKTLLSRTPKVRGN